MAKKEFILQGFTSRTHRDAVRELFALAHIETVILSVSFVSESGVQEIEDQLRANASCLTVLAGIRNDITSHQALARLHAISGSDVYTVDTGSRSIIFHPKLYLVRGASRARVVLGSANLTLGGLNNNIEAGMMLDFDLKDPADRAVIGAIESQLRALPSEYPLNIVRIGALADVDALLASGRVVDEMAMPPPRPATSVGSSADGDAIPRISLKVTPLRRPLTVSPRAGRPIPSIAASATVPPPSPAPARGVDLELVWESKPLTRRDIQIPDSVETHPTGSVNLDKGLLPEAVDHRHYFREQVFAWLTWTSRSGTVDEARAPFQLVLRGISYGEFELEIAHTKSATSRTYIQRNAMTRLSWGPMREYVAKPDLIGRTLALYRDKADPRRFVLEID